MDFSKKIMRIIKIENLFPECFELVQVEGDERYFENKRINEITNKR